MREDGYMNQIGDMCASSCAAPEPGYSMELGEANAKLMAAAPDLLSACAAMICTWGSQDEDAIIAARDQARAAIIKATEEGA